MTKVGNSSQMLITYQFSKIFFILKKYLSFHKTLFLLFWCLFWVSNTFSNLKKFQTVLLIKKQLIYHLQLGIWKIPFDAIIGIWLESYQKGNIFMPTLTFCNPQPLQYCGKKNLALLWKCLWMYCIQRQRIRIHCIHYIQKTLQRWIFEI